MDADQLIQVYRSMFTAREIDRLERELTTRGEAFFHVSGAGHEGSAALAAHLKPEDWLHCHYRDKALMTARGVQPNRAPHTHAVPLASNATTWALPAETATTFSGKPGIGTGPSRPLSLG